MDLKVSTIDDYSPDDPPEDDGQVKDIRREITSAQKNTQRVLRRYTTNPRRVSRLIHELRSMMLEHGRLHLRNALDAIAANDPVAYCQLLARLIPVYIDMDVKDDRQKYTVLRFDVPVTPQIASTGSPPGETV